MSWGESTWLGRGSSGQSLSFKSTVELVQVVGQTAVVSGVGGFLLEVGNLPEPFPDRSRVVSRELVFSLSDRLAKPVLIIVRLYLYSTFHTIIAAQCVLHKYK